ncbi:MAG: helix-turn-helix domain-containing protein [Anaerotignaceae bacterium]
MMKLDVLTLLKRNNKTKYWLYKRLGMSYQNFNKMVNNQTSSIRYEVLEEICNLLNCTPNDLFVLSDMDSIITDASKVS